MKRFLMIFSIVALAVAARAETNALVGVWASDPTLSQLGQVITQYEFNSNGAFGVSVQFLSATNLPTRTTTGTFSVVDGKLVMTTKWKTNTADFVLNDDQLTITERKNKVFQLKRRK